MQNRLDCLSCHHSQGDVRSCVHFFDEAHVIYPAGSNIVVYNTETHTQYKIQAVGEPKDREGSQTRAEITAMALSSNRKYLAVTERCVPPRDFFSFL